MDEDEQYQESIHQYVCSNEFKDPDIKTLGEDWSRLCDDLNINLGYVRSKVDDWFMEVYRSRRDLSDVMEDSSGKCQTRKDQLYWKFVEDFEREIQNSKLIYKSQMKHAFDKIKSDYSCRQEEWVDLAVKCVEEESRLLNKYKMTKRQNNEREQASLQVNYDIEQAEQIRLAISDDLKKMKSMVSILQDLYEKKDEKTDHYKVRQVIQIRQHGTIPNAQYFKTQLSQINSDIDTSKTELQTLHTQISGKFNTLLSVLNGLVTHLKTKVKEWQREFQLNYAELDSSPELDKIAPWCSHVGKIIHDVLHGSLANWQNIFCSAPNSTFETPNGNCQNYITFFDDMLTDFLKSTFVVTEQGNFFIKTGNKRFPKFSVRILAADLFGKHSEETTARFISEDDLKLCFDGDSLDMKLIEKYERKLKSNKIKFSAENGKDKMECHFPNLQFAQGFKRTNKEVNRQVHEEKYRVVFVTKIASVSCWTLSLPLVVTTASNQEAHSLASIMWQCYSSTDVFTNVNDTQEDLPWSDVADMLQKKMARLSTKQRLSPENITHLKNRLFGQENMPDDSDVSLTQFCWSYMEDTEFSFWKWFLGVYNLIEQYLQVYWNDGLIMGFVNKDRAEQMLASPSVTAGTFILRFSDKHFTNSDGRKSVYGRLTSCVSVMKEFKGMKRSSCSHHKEAKRLVIEHVDVADFKKLGGELKKQESDEGAKNNLANILKETWIKDREGQSQVQMYRFLYPYGKPREELFDKYCEEGTAVSGYKHTREAYIAILEQAMSKVSLSKQSHSSAQTLLDRNIKSESSVSKKPKLNREYEVRRKRSSRQSSSHSNISSPHESPFHEQSPISHCQSPASSRMSPMYPTQSPYPHSSPAQSVPSPAYSIQAKSNPDDIVPCAEVDDKSLLPTFLNGQFQVSSTLEENVGCLPVSRTAHVTDSGIQNLDVMELAFENNENSCNGANSDFTSNIMSQDVIIMDSVSTDDSNIVYDNGRVVIQNKEMNAWNTESSVELTVIRNNEGEFDLSSKHGHKSLREAHPSVNESLDVSCLAPDQRKQVEAFVEQLRRANEMKSENTPVVSSDASICDIPVSTSSGSSGVLSDYSAMQLAAMGSGDIDPNFASIIVDHDSMYEDTSDT